MSVPSTAFFRSCLTEAGSWTWAAASGLWLTYLALEKPKLRLDGIDPDRRKLVLARTSRAGEFELHEGSAGDLPDGTYDCITILDVLYLMHDEQKAAVLSGCFRALRPGGTLVVKELDTRPWWKFVPSAVEELLAVRLVNLTHGERLHFLECRGAGRWCRG